MKIFLRFISILAVYVLLCSHEFWLSPDKYIYQRTEAINIRFLVGENFEGDNWNGNNSRIQTLTFYYGGVRDDLSEYLSENNGDSLQLTMVDEGTAMIAFNSNNSFIELESGKFNAYLEEDGLNDAIAYRNQHHQTDSTGYEYYQRCAKAIIQVGKTRDNTYKATTGMPVDIIPQYNPYSLNNEDSIRVKILFEKNPLQNALVKVWHRQNDTTIKKEMLTDENGEIVFPVITSGRWMVSTVKMIRLENDSRADWQSYWGSLTWGYE